LEYSEWKPVYLEICEDLGIDPYSDDQSVRALMAVTLNSDLQDGDILEETVGKTVTVFGDSYGLEKDIGKNIHRGTQISAGSATERVLAAGIVPDIVVTDLDGNAEAQIEASSMGSVTLILAHGDNPELVTKYAGRFEGPVILTTQSKPYGIVMNFGGFTDGDRAVCTARHFGAKEIMLEGFDFERPRVREGEDPERSAKKLRWAEKIIKEMNPADVVLRFA
jgi:uncharacterized Rossmann fold enzyme